MYRTFAAVATLLIIASALMYSAQPARAVSTEQGQLKPDDTSIYNLVTMDCLAVKFKLSDVHQQDGLLRVVLGQNYDTMSTKLMARLNARIVENRLDGSELIKTAAEFEKALASFRNDYKAYEVAMNSLMKSDCQSQIQTYYISLQTTKDLRIKVDEDVQELNKIMQRYHDAFVKFQKDIAAQEKAQQDDTE